MDFELTVKEGRQPGRTFGIPSGSDLTVGRAPDCDIRLVDQGVSRRHCRIQNAGSGLRVVDLGSANGTYVNGDPVETSALKPGDQLAVGPTILECQAAPGSDEAEEMGTATVAIRDESTKTVVRKVVDTQQPALIEERTPTPDELRDLQQAQRNLATAYQVSKLLASAPNQQSLYDGVIQSIFKTINADRAALLLEPENGADDERLEVVAARSRKSGSDVGEIRVSRTVVRDVLDNRVSTLSQDATADARYREGQSIIQQRIRSVMCAPVATDERILGVLYADSRSLRGAFSEGDLELLALIGNQAGIGIHRVQLMAQLEKTLLDTIRAIVATIDAKDGYTHRHSERVAAFATKIARELGQDEEQLEVIKLSALLHDVGKIGVPESILNKPGKLTDEEFEEVKKHPVHGVNILSHMENPRFEAILPGVRHHHEKWDGSGYPDGLAEDEIPFLGRLLAVADVLDALSSARAYREGLGFEKTVGIIGEDAGSHFDPEIAEAAMELHERDELDVPAEWIEPDEAAGTLDREAS